MRKFILTIRFRLALAFGAPAILTLVLSLIARTEEQAASLEQTVASMAELTVTVAQNTDRAREADALASWEHPSRSGRPSRFFAFA